MHAEGFAAANRVREAVTLGTRASDVCDVVYDVTALGRYSLVLILVGR